MWRFSLLLNDHKACYNLLHHLKFESLGYETCKECQMIRNNILKEADSKGSYWAPMCKATFTHETESPWPVHFKHSHWWKRRSRSKFTPQYAWGTNGVCDCKMDVKSTWIPTWHWMDHVLWLLGLFSNTISWRWVYHKTRTPWHSERSQPSLYSIYHVWGPAWIKIHWNSIWLRAQSHMASHYTWGPVTTLRDFEGVLRRPLDTFIWALAISWSRLLARVWIGPYVDFWV